MALTAHYITPTGSDTWANSTNASTPCSWATMITNATAGDWCKALQGTYSMAADVSLAGQIGTASAPFILQGFASFGPDVPSSHSRTNGVGALITSDMPTIAMASAKRITVMGAYSTINSFIITGTMNNALLATNSYSQILNCSITNAQNGVAAQCMVLSHYTIVSNCDCTNSNATQSSTVITGSGSAVKVYDCNLKNASATCVSVINITGSVVNCRIMASAGVGISVLNGGVSIDHNTIYSQGVAAIQTPNAVQTAFLSITNNNLTDNATAWLNLYKATGQHPVFWRNNRTRDNTAAPDVGDWPIHDDVTTDNGNYTTDYVDAPSGDLRLAAASVARNAALGGGDIGACQRVENYPAAANLLDSATCDSGAVVGTYHAPLAAEVISTAVFGPSSGTAGTFDEAARNTDPTEAKVETGTSYKIANVTKNGSYPTTATSKAAQLVDDVAAVEAKKAFLDSTQAILGVTGTLVMSLYTLISSVVAAAWVVIGQKNYTGGADGTYPTTATSEAAGAAAQLVTDRAAVNTDKASILNTATILTITGTFSEAARNTDPGEANVLLDADYKILGADLTGELVAGVPTDVEFGLTYANYDSVISH